MKKSSAEPPQQVQNGWTELARISAEAGVFRLKTVQERDQETRRRKSEAMKEFNRRTGKITSLGNGSNRKFQKPK